MNVRELITELLEFDMDTIVKIKVNFSNDEFESNDVEVKRVSYLNDTILFQSADMNSALIDSNELEELKNKAESPEEQVRDLKEEKEKLEEELEELR